MRLLLATVVAAAAAQRGATPTGHALLLGTQRTGTTWAMAELAKSPCVSTTSELFIQFKWERGARMACLKMLYGDADARDRSLGGGRRRRRLRRSTVESASSSHNYSRSSARPRAGGSRDAAAAKFICVRWE